MEERVKILEDEVKELQKNSNDINKVVAVFTEKLDNLVKSIDNLSTQFKANVIDINHKYEKLEIKVEKLQEELNEKTIGEDAKRYKTIITAILTGIVGIIIGLIFKNN